MVTELLGAPDSKVDPSVLPAWLTERTITVGEEPVVETIPIGEHARNEARAAAADANVARFVFIGILAFLLLLYILADIACRTRIGRMIAHAESEGVEWEAAQ